MPYILPAKSPVLGRFKCFGSGPCGAVLVEAAAGHHVLYGLEKHATVRRCSDVDVGRETGILLRTFIELRRTHNSDSALGAKSSETKEETMARAISL